jgi:hypothetical protein
LQQDPVGYADGTNLYGYVGNSPASAQDPSGLVETRGGIVIQGIGIILGTVRDALPGTEGDPFWDLWTGNRTSGREINITNTAFGRTVRGLATTGWLESDALEDLQRQLARKVRSAPACPNPFPVVVSKELPGHSTAGVDSRWAYMRIGTLHATYYFRGTATREENGFRVRGRMTMDIWDNWQWTLRMPRELGSGTWATYKWHVLYTLDRGFWIPNTNSSN